MVRDGLDDLKSNKRRTSVTAQPLIPAQYAEVFWEDDEETGAAGADVIVIDMRERLEHEARTGKDLANRYASSTGAHTDAWMTNVHPQAKPEGVFAANWLDRPASRKAIKAALREFSKIEECPWARAMYETLDRIDRKSRGED
jgi:hypothetical protein